MCGSAICPPSSPWTRSWCSAPPVTASASSRWRSTAIIGGLGEAVCSLLSEKLPTPCAGSVRPLRSRLGGAGRLRPDRRASGRFHSGLHQEHQQELIAGFAATKAARCFGGQPFCVCVWKKRESPGAGPPGRQSGGDKSGGTRRRTTEKNRAQPPGRRSAPCWMLQGKGKITRPRRSGSAGRPGAADSGRAPAAARPSCHRRPRPACPAHSAPPCG